MTSTRRIRIHEVLVHLGFEDEAVLTPLRAEGLFVEDEVDAGEAEELRVALMMMSDLGCERRRCARGAQSATSPPDPGGQDDGGRPAASGRTEAPIERMTRITRMKRENDANDVQQA